MSKDKIADYDGTTAANNTDIGGISIAEGMLPSAVNNSMRELTKQLGAFANGTDAIDALTVTGDLTVDTSTLKVDSTNNRVGIGITGPTEDLHIKGKDGAHADVIIQAFTGYNSGLNFNDNAGMAGRIVYNHSNNFMEFDTNGSEAMRIDSSGNLLVAKTTSSITGVGAVLTSNGVVKATVDSTRGGHFNRINSDGEIIRLDKDGTTVGSIGSDAGVTIYMDGGGARAGIYMSGSGVLPRYNGALADNSTDLGTSNRRFKDLYLSGSAQLANITNGAGEKLILNSDNMVFQVQASEAMRIDSSGNLLVGKTSSSATTQGIEARADGRLWVVTSSDDNIFNRTGTNGGILSLRKDGSEVGSIGIAGSQSDILTINSSTNSTSCGLGFYSDNTVRPIGNTGTDRDNAVDLGRSLTRFDDIFATNGTIQTSDQQEKNTITDSDLGLDFINRLSPKSYIFNGKTRTHYGLIAQDVETVLGDISKPTSGFAGFIKSDISEEEDGSEYRYGLRYTEFVGPLIKALQEADAKIEALEARIAALEGA